MYRACGFFGGPTVTIYVGSEATKKKYILPKTYLCEQSAYFKAAFEGRFQEGEEQALQLDEDSPEHFELVIQWLYTKRVILPRHELPRHELPKDLAAEKSLLQEKITGYLNFIVLCNKLLLLGDQAEVVEKVKASLITNRKALLPHHVRTAMKLPSRHPIRQLFANTAVPYHLDVVSGTKASFWLADEMVELEGFASDMMAATSRLWASISVPELTWLDPLSEKSLSLDYHGNGRPFLTLELPA
jgi:BTB/POZ domain